LDTSNPVELVETAEIDLSKSEDNVASLAVGTQHKGTATLVYAGVNSSPSEVEKGKNQHFRVFGIEQAAKGKGKGRSTQTNSTTKISELSKSTLFIGVEADLYQRVLRLSRGYPKQPQLGAIATGLAKKSELVVFDTSSPTQPKPRDVLRSEKEIEDIDFMQTGGSGHFVAYCDEYDVYIKKISPKANEEPECVYITPASREARRPTIPKFRALRWLAREYLLMLTNIHGNNGVVLQILRVRPDCKGQCRIVQSLRLPSNISKASGLAVSNLTPPASPFEAQGYTQFVIAVVGQDISISLFKIDLKVEGEVYTTSSIYPFRTFKSVHPFPITNITFSNFTPPAQPVTASTPPQYLKLASVSVGNTAIVHTLPLFPVPLSIQKGQSKTPRYVVAVPSSATTSTVVSILSFIAITLVAILIQGVLEMRGIVRPTLNAVSYIPVEWQPLLVKPYIVPGELTGPAVASADGLAPLHNLIDRLKSNGEGVVIIHDTPDSEGGVKAALHPERDDGSHGGKSWDALSHEDKEAWKKKLKDAGHWAEEFGETVFKSVLFGELAGVVGQVVQGG
jgi:hypothetical protein